MAPSRPTRQGGRPRRDIGSFSNITTKQLPSGLWQARGRVRTLEGKDRQLARTRDTKQAAINDLHTALRAEAERATALDVDHDTTFGALAVRYLAEVRRRSAGSTYYQYRYRINKILVPEFGALPPRQITPARIGHLFDRLEDEGTAPATMRNIRSPLSGILQLAVDDDLLVRNPVLSAKKIRGKSAPPRALTEEEITAILARADTDEVAARYDLPDIIRLFLGTGMRVGELCGLCWDSVDLAESTITLRRMVTAPGGHMVISEGKTAAARRTLAMSDVVFEVMFRRSQDADLPPDSPVFSNRFGSYRHTRHVQAALRRLYRDIPRLGWITQPTHVYRKTVATKLKQAGVPDLDIADFMGHEDIRTTQKSYVDRTGAKPATAAILNGLGKVKT